MPDNLRVSLDLTARDGLSPEVRRAVQSVKELQTGVATTNGIATSDPGHTLAERLGADAQGATQQMNQLAQSLQNVLGQMGLGGLGGAGGGIISGRTALWAAGITVVGGAAASAVGDMIRLNAELETSTATFKAITHDGTLAAQMIASLRREADVTPFSTSEVIRAGKALVSSANGSTDALMRLVRTAEVLAALKPEQGLEGAAFALREATAGQFFSLTSRFEVPLNVVNQLKGEGLSGLELVDEALRRIGVDYGLVAAQGATFAGQLSTLQSTFQNLEQRIGKGVFDELATDITQANSSLQGMNVELGNAADLLSKVFGAMARPAPWAGPIVAFYVHELSEAQQAIKALQDLHNTFWSGKPNQTGTWGLATAGIPQAAPSLPNQMDLLRQQIAAAQNPSIAFNESARWQLTTDVAAFIASLKGIQVEYNGLVMASGQLAAGLGQPFRDAAKDIEIARTRVTDLDAAINELGTRRGRLKGFLGDINEAIRVYRRAGMPVPQELLEAKAGIRQDLPTLLLQQVTDELKVLKTEGGLKTLISQQMDVQAQTVNINGGGLSTSDAYSRGLGRFGHAVGTPYVQQDGPAWLHVGEAVLSRYQAQATRMRDRGRGGDVHANDQRQITNQVTVYGAAEPARTAAETVSRLEDKYASSRGVSMRLVGVGG